ncbi:VOC family protein [uncultured Roseovarius sp.]|uniref:VOC family protein n=1 Tax=uncultured Roseovarius sp. TaxID=293344 RepID=UPI0026361AB8|nr:VOC family protein [uncultured Roseovarius sp.]
MSGRVTGIGGIFFRTTDPAALADWYATHLGVTSFGPWRQDEGISVFAPFEAGTDYWPSDRQWMLNLRVEGLDALIQQLAQAGIPAETRPDEWDTPETGRFARITDPEGNDIELWEPPAP